MSGCEDGSQLLLPWTGQPSLTSSNISFFDGPTIILQAVEQYLDGKWAEVSFYPEAGVGPPQGPVPVSKRKGVINSIHCAECPHTYIGQTRRSLDLRLQEHLAITNC